jgi:hypothetical protein
MNENNTKGREDRSSTTPRGVEHPAAPENDADPGGSRHADSAAAVPRSQQSVELKCCLLARVN